MFRTASPASGTGLTHESLEKDHRRIEKCTYTKLCASEVFNEGEYDHCQGWASLMEVEREVNTLEGKKHSERQYYINSLSTEDYEQISTYICGHLVIESRLDWHLYYVWGGYLPS